jgi:cytochrome c peroxidase
MRRFALFSAAALIAGLTLVGQDANQKIEKRAPSSYSPVVIKEPFEDIMRRMIKAKPDILRRQHVLLEERYDLSDKPSKTARTFRGRPLQDGVRVRLPQGQTWESLAAMTPQEIRDRDLFPKGFLPLPHANHEEGGMVFPKFHIDEVKKQENRDMVRFDLDFDLPEHFLPEFPPPIFLTTRPDLGDVSQGELVTLQNFQRLFNGILPPKQLDGLRLLLTQFPQQQFNQTEDRRSPEPSRGVTCFDCHANGHTNASFHLVGDIRPQHFRRRIDTPSLRGLNQQRLFGSQRALKTVEDFTEFEQRAAYFDGDHVIATKKGVNVLERATQVQHMSEFQEMLDFPPAPKLGWDAKLDPRKATESEMRGQAIFFGKGRCAECHVPPIYSDNMMHDLQVSRFYSPRMINGRAADVEGPVKTFPLRGIKESAPYFHDGRLLTLDDVVEFFNLILELKLNAQEKTDLLAFLRAL